MFKVFVLLTDSQGDVNLSISPSGSLMQNQKVHKLKEEVVQTTQWLNSSTHWAVTPGEHTAAAAAGLK